MHPVLRTVLQRLGLGLVTLFIVSIVIFAAIEMLPGDFAKSILGQAATPETVAAFQKEIGLDKPPVTRYFEWIGGVMQGDFGASFSARGDYRRQVIDIIGPRLKNTLFLASVTAVIAVPLALALGLLAALYRNSLYDRLINASTLTMISFPEFFIAYILMLVLAVNLGWFPSLARVNPDMPFFERLYRAGLPVLTLTLVTWPI